jgi:hypothetical protein
VPMIEQRRAASALVQELNEALNDIILPGIAGDRFGFISEQDEKDIGAGKRIDLRLPRFLAVSGKGGPGHEEWSNVTLFDHASSVGMAAATFAALDLLAAEQGVEEVKAAAAVALAVGLLHDIDKLLKKPWHTVSAEDARDIFGAYRIGDFLERFSVRISSEQFATLIAYVETRSADRLPNVRVPDSWKAVARRYVRFADALDGVWLRGVPAVTVREVLKAWKHEIGSGSRFFVPQAFGDYRPLLISDPHHPFILARLAAEIDYHCEEVAGMRPLFHAVRDETLVSLLPDDSFEAIARHATDAVADGLPFESEIIIMPAGVPKISGSKPSWNGVRSIVEQGVPTGKLRRLLAVKMTDFMNLENELRDLARGARCPFSATDKLPSGQTLPIIRSVEADSAEFPAVVEACLVSLAIGVEEATKNKAYTRNAREDQIVGRLGGDLPGWLSRIDPLTRRTAISLIALQRADSDPELKRCIWEIFAGWFAEDAVFGDMRDKGSAVRDAVRGRLRLLATGEPVAAADAAQHCLITGEPIEAEPIEKKDSLYGINSSAISYRAGRAEEKFREDAETYLSSVSYAEYRLRAARFAKLSRPKAGISLRLSSPTAGGIFSLTINSMNDQEYGLSDMVSEDQSKRVYQGLEAYRTRTNLGRFEIMPGHFADRATPGRIKATPGRISFIRIAMKAALRYGRPVHLFSGLPHPRREFFYCDCVDPEIRVLLGKDGFRIEELSDAIAKLDVLDTISGPRKDHKLGLVGVAKSFCLPSTRFTAACLAWATARDREEASSPAISTLHQYIEREVAKMDQDNTVAPPVLLGRLASMIQRRPGRDASAKDETFLIDMALEGTLYAYKNGWRDREGLIAEVAGRIRIDGERRQEGARGFYSASANREAGQSIEQAIESFAEGFVDRAWFGTFKGRPPSAGDLRNFMAAYRWTFTRSVAKSSSRPDIPVEEAS